MTLREILTECSGATESSKDAEAVAISALLRAPRGAWQGAAFKAEADCAELSAIGDFATALLLTLPDHVLDQELDSEKQVLFAEPLISARLARRRFAKAD